MVHKARAIALVQYLRNRLYSRTRLDNSVAFNAYANMADWTTDSNEALTLSLGK